MGGFLMCDNHHPYQVSPAGAHYSMYARTCLVSSNALACHPSLVKTDLEYVDSKGYHWKGMCYNRWLPWILLPRQFRHELEWNRLNTIFKRRGQWTGGSKTQGSKTMLKNKFCELKNRIFCRGCKKLLCDFIMNTRSPILRICLIQGLISAWFRLWGKRKASILKNENSNYS
jgi:hypothetical protein